MKVEIWSDIMCPFCYIGKRRFEAALEKFEQKEKVEIVWRSFQLDPQLEPVPGMSIHQYLAQRKGVSDEEGKRMNDYMGQMASEIGLEYNFEQMVVNNTMDAHRLLHLASIYGVQNQAKELLFGAYYTDGKDVGNGDVLSEIGQSLGLNPQEVREMLASDRFKESVRQDQQEAQQLGANGVPFFVMNQKYAVSGAQPTELFAEVLEKIWEEEKPKVIASEGPSCGPDGNC